MPIHRLYIPNRPEGDEESKTLTLDQLEARPINKFLTQRYSLVSQVAQDETKVIGIVVGTVVVNEYMALINKLKQVIIAAGKKPYEILVGKLNEPKLKNIAMIDLYCLVSCRETSIVGPRDFMATVVTPHEVFMALIPGRFPWQCKIQTDFRLLLSQFGDNNLMAEDLDQEQEEKTAEELKEEMEDQMQLVKVEHRDLVPIFSS